ncbi:uncharacterized protein MONBRDRAFT_36118 [Monosiga brevicollis MX1]|uniref:Alpha-galactosidase n=1 Tax=Monosiga brevicollis TaxID=81824 RepID=A9UT67_MONBE|nr:uncharacterized protein MONBRDRAFT_36118 [Monosiga brevicollis MX1]EDQ91439.1 predicted protein [Monosiga brevicollis MX1]|eukprot:XP_001743861.1 hypothetical protein [Monosiga brevicollis MX1]
MSVNAFGARLAVFVALALVPALVAADVGILYEVWHTTAAQAMQQVAAMHGTQLTTERVIRSNGAQDLNDVYGPYNISSDIYNVEPALGFYCLYRARAGEPGLVPDCPNITQTATAHAKLLVDMGIDYVMVDVTNWPTNTTSTDISVIRPTEVLFEEWYKLRQQNISTPAIAVWPCSPAGSNTWQVLLDKLYNNASYASLVYQQNGKKVVAIPKNPNCYDEGVAAAIAANGGRNDVTTINLWALFGPADYEAGTWGFFSPCVSSTDGTSYTTSIVGEPACNQRPTLDPATGGITEISASGAYMVSQSALPFANPGHLRGLTVARLFERVLDLRPPHLFLSSFNEHIGGRQQPVSSSKIAFNMGLPNDSQRDVVWVDTYASEFSRDMEPTVEGGDTVYRVASACVALYKAGLNCTAAPTDLCCTRADKEVFANVWSLSHASGNVYDTVLTTNAAEVSALETDGWAENCSPISGPSVFCVDTSLTDGRNGPFILYNQQLPNTIPLYRCNEPQQTHHHISTDPNCDGDGAVESTLGFIAQQRGGETLRGLYRCKTPQGGYAHSLDLPCDTPDGPVLGYVR